MNRGFEGCLVLYPLNEWEKITARMQRLNLFQAKTRAFFRAFHNGATAISLDSSGRILVPKSLMEYAGLKRDIVLFAYADRIEIWSLTAYRAAMNQDADAFAALAEEVMGSLPTDEPAE